MTYVSKFEVSLPSVFQLWWKEQIKIKIAEVLRLEQGLNDKLEKIEQLEQQLIEKDEQEQLNTTQINEMHGMLFSREQQVSSLNNN